MVDQQHFHLITDRVRTWNRWYHQHPQEYPDFHLANLPNAQLSHARLQQADFSQANLDGVFLNHANLRHANFTKANLRGAHLAYADLSHAKLTGADLTGANLSDANLYRTLFHETILTETRLHQVLLRETLFSNINLSTAIGLETGYYLAPCSIGADTISRSGNKLPQRLLQQANIHENLLTSIFEQRKDAFAYATTFISYASEDHRFVSKLYNDLTEAGVWCWFAPKSLKAGDYWRTRIDQGIKQCDKMLVILSPAALVSGWVQYEVNLARQKERKYSTEIIVPLCLQPEIARSLDWATFLRKKRYMPSFNHWNDPPRYQKEFNSLLDVLRIET